LKPDPLRNVDDWLAHYRHFWMVNLQRLKHHIETEK
jgi:hypothetical protein